MTLDFVRKTIDWLKERSKFHQEDNFDHGHPKYNNWEPRAKTIKICAQMLIGGMLVFLLVTKFWFHLANLPYPDWLSYVQTIHSLKTLEIVSRALAYSAGIELAYMLFTPGPDEAIEPLITGAAAALLFGISKSDELKIQTVASIFLFVLVIAALFVVKELFIEDKNAEKIRLIDTLRQRANE